MAIEQRSNETSLSIDKPQFPFSISDNVQIDVAGLKYGSREDIVEEHCNACGYDRARRYEDYPIGGETTVCNGCGHLHGDEYNYAP